MATAALLINEEDETGDDEPLENKADRLISLVSTFARSVSVTAGLIHRRSMFDDMTIGVELTDLFADFPGKGCGTMVMEYLARLADQEGLAAYVKPGSPRNRVFYARFGFEVTRGACGFEMVRPAPPPTWFLEQQRGNGFLADQSIVAGDEK
ncbi:MAG: N-acetyltransferase [Acidiferrobacterales bacterium]